MSDAVFQRLSPIYGDLLDSVTAQSDYSRLSEPQRTFFFCMTADGSINSDGMYALWFNDFHVIPPFLLPSAFRTIGAPASAAAIERFTSAPLIRMPPFRSIRFRSYQMALLSLVWPPDDELSSAYYDAGEDIDSLLLSYFGAHESAFTNVA